MFLPVDPLADDLRKLRLDRGIGQGELAEKIGTSREQLCRWEKGRSSPTLYWIRRWVAALQPCTLAVLTEPEAPTE